MEDKNISIISYLLRAMIVGDYKNALGFVENKDFELVEERQFFPFEVYDSCLYFARLKKVEKNSD